MLFAAAPASAENVYGGGGTLAAGLFRHWLDCRGQVFNGGLPPACPSSSDRLTNNYAYAGVGSGAGVTAFLGQTSPTATPTAPKFANGNQDWTISGITYPYTRFDFAGSDASLTDAQINTYNSSVQPTRGAAVQVPIVATPVTIPVNMNGLTLNA